MEKVQLIGADLAAMQELMSTLKEPPFRAKQVMQWIYQRGRFDFQQMGNLPKTLRDKTRWGCFHCASPHHRKAPLPGWHPEVLAGASRWSDGLKQS